MSGTARFSGGTQIAVIPAALAGVRIDRAVCILTGLTRREASDLIDCAAVSVDGIVVTERNRKVREGERLEIQPAGLDSGSLVLRQEGSPATVDFTVVHADEHVIIVDKPAGLVVHHGAGHHRGTLVDGLLERFPDLANLGARAAAGAAGSVGDPDRPGIVHRLDKGTSGLMVVARSEEAMASLSEQLRTRRAGRQYLALVAGDVVHDQGLVDAPVGRSGRVATRMAVTPKGKAARTAYTVLERMAGPPAATLVEAILETGRTHQVRVHMAAIGHPVAGDDRYGERSRTSELMSGVEPAVESGRFFLHAHRLVIDHPTDGRVSWTSALPDDLSAVLDARRKAGESQ
jgi:23S rRNA pseudouridine1911/1915/1917 synthase